MGLSINEALNDFAGSLTQEIKSYEEVDPKIYAYNTIHYPPNEGWTKIGYTNQTVEKRIYQQTHTANVATKIAWKERAQFRTGKKEFFDDHAFHNFLTEKKHVARRKGQEWFKIDGKKSHAYFNEFINGAAGDQEHSPYVLRKEQEAAVAMTMAYFKKGGKKFLWNAKPRFGKTLTAYDLIRKMGFEKVLVVTNRPVIASSWADDFFRFISWQAPLQFLSASSSLEGDKRVMTHEDYTKQMMDLNWEYKGFIDFESLQNLKGSAYLGGKFDKLEWVQKYHFDLLIIDEAQEGVDTIRTDKAFEKIQRDHTLYLSGTPFKALASNEFDGDQIYNWTYADEQEAKANWDSEDYNPYEDLPKLEMFTYQMSPMIYDTVSKGADISDDGDTVDFAFDLNEFFLTKANGTFVHEEEVRKFLHSLYTYKKYPFSTEKLQKELAHTLWYMNRIDSAKALAKLLAEDDVFKNYKVILAVGDGSENDDASGKKVKNMRDKVLEEIRKNPKTITLTVGQLTVGVTVKPWSAVLMLCNLKSPSAYMQAAFRAQNPYSYTDKTGHRFRKETSYVFDFDPARTLIIFDQFANNLSPDTVDGRGTTEERKKNIRRLLNFFPVIGEDSEGKMVELDAAKVLSIPRKLKCEDVVRKGFMSNFLFQNIGNVFGAPREITDILKKLTPAIEETPNREVDISEASDMLVDEDGNPIVDEERVIGTAKDLFGDKMYVNLGPDTDSAVNAFTKPKEPEQLTDKKIQEKQKKQLVTAITKQVIDQVAKPVFDKVDSTKSTQRKVESEVRKELDRKVTIIQDNMKQKANVAQVELNRKDEELKKEVLKNNITENERKEKLEAAQKEYHAKVEKAQEELKQETKNLIEETSAQMPQRISEIAEQERLEEQKREKEGGIRDQLRGFSRTIPSFIMAYGDENLTLATLDEYTEDDVFKEVTGITEEEFKLLRDGGTITDPDTGETKEFAGHLFDEVVFNDSVQQFLAKKKELANYFDKKLQEDIFDYIPPQKTNQIFTPRRVVKQMVDELEKNNPGCFDDPKNTFADLYMKSGLYITEIVKRLYRSEKMKKLYPNDRERIRHIINHQVYGMAPTRIIYLIAINYILGFEGENVKDGKFPHFVQADAAEAAKNGTLQKLVDEKFGE